MPVHFVLKRYLPEFGDGKMDLYEAIKTGKKTSEYRDATEYWAKRLLNSIGLNKYYFTLERNKDPKQDYDVVKSIFDSPDLKHTKCTFRVGYTKGPTLHATIKDITWRPMEQQFEIRIKNVREKQQ